MTGTAMDDEELGTWLPMTVAEASAIFTAAPFRWYITGGRALELAVGSSWRDHTDLDIGVGRQDLSALYRHLAGWDLHVAAAGVLTPWDGRPLSEKRHENNVWARRTPREPWALDITVGGGDDTFWCSRRDGTIRLSWADAVLEVAGIPFLAPHVQLLMKSKRVRPKDQRDADVVIPSLAPEQRSWLMQHLPRDHPWQAMQGGS